jgi:hypothetical protein
VRNSILGHIDGWPRGVSGIKTTSSFIFIFFCLKFKVKSFLIYSYSGIK